MTEIRLADLTSEYYKLVRCRSGVVELALRTAYEPQYVRPYSRKRKKHGVQRQLKTEQAAIRKLTRLRNTCKRVVLKTEARTKRYLRRHTKGQKQEKGKKHDENDKET